MFILMIFFAGVIFALSLVNSFNTIIDEEPNGHLIPVGEPDNSEIYLD